MESHAGLGKIWALCYSGFQVGAAIDKRADRAEHLARQRPGWAVYEGEAEKVLALGAGAHLPINVLDCDPYGYPWPCFDAFLGSGRKLPGKLLIFATDGGRMRVRIKQDWQKMPDEVRRFGVDHLHAEYAEVCRFKVSEKLATKYGYRCEAWTAYHCGKNDLMTHFAALLTQ